MRATGALARQLVASLHSTAARALKSDRHDLIPRIRMPLESSRAKWILTSSSGVGNGRDIASRKDARPTPFALVETRTSAGVRDEFRRLRV